MLLGRTRKSAQVDDEPGQSKKSSPGYKQREELCARLNVEGRFAMLFPLQRLVPFRFIRFLEIHPDSVRFHSSMISSCHPGATHFDRSTNTITPHISRYRGVSDYRICATPKLLRTWSEGMSRVSTLPIQLHFRITATCWF